jgi:hypothetical protein
LPATTLSRTAPQSASSLKISATVIDSWLSLDFAR